MWNMFTEITHMVDLSYDRRGYGFRQPLRGTIFPKILTIMSRNTTCCKSDKEYVPQRETSLLFDDAITHIYVEYVY